MSRFCVSTSVSRSLQPAVPTTQLSSRKMSKPSPPVTVSEPLPESITSSNGVPMRRSSPRPPTSWIFTRFGCTGATVGSSSPIGEALIVSFPPRLEIVSVSPSARFVFWTVNSATLECTTLVTVLTPANGRSCDSVNVSSAPSWPRIVISSSAPSSATVIRGRLIHWPSSPPSPSSSSHTVSVVPVSVTILPASMVTRSTDEFSRLATLRSSAPAPRSITSSSTSKASNWPPGDVLVTRIELANGTVTEILSLPAEAVTSSTSLVPPPAWTASASPKPGIEMRIRSLPSPASIVSWPPRPSSSSSPASPSSRSPAEPPNRLSLPLPPRISARVAPLWTM